MIEYFAKHNIHLDQVDEMYGGIDEYILAAKIYLQDENFDQLETLAQELDYEMLTDALKGLYILALELRFLDLYQDLVEAYACVVDESYDFLSTAINQSLEKRNRLREIFNV